MRFKLDENLGQTAIIALETEGHDVSSVHIQKMDGAVDREVLEVCVKEGRILVTLDTDFANPLNFDPRGSSGIAVLRLSRNSGPTEIQAGIAALIDGLRQQSIAGCLWVVRSDRIRIWKPPL